MCNGRCAPDYCYWCDMTLVEQQDTLSDDHQANLDRAEKNRESMYSTQFAREQESWIETIMARDGVSRDRAEFIVIMSN